MKKVRAFQLMEENRSFLKVWKQKNQEHCLWTNGRVAFLDMEFMHYPPGYYVYRERTLMPIDKAKFPTAMSSIKRLIKSTTGGLRGYGKAQLPYNDSSEKYLSVLCSTDGASDLLKLKARKATVYINYDYYLYIARWLVSNWTQFKVKDISSPILIYSEKELRGLIMPVSYEVERERENVKESI